MNIHASILAQREHRPPCALCHHSAGRPGMTLVEMMVAVTSTLILMGLVAQLFSMLGQGVNGSRNIVELADRMRSVQYSLRHDLAGATAAGFQPPLDPAKNLGYFELIEGADTDTVTYLAGPRFEKDGFIDSPNAAPPFNDRTALDFYISQVGSDDRLVGDVDDILVFTTRTVGEPFTGKTDISGNPSTNSIESSYAEVAWFCRRMPNTANPTLYALHRRQRLIVAHPGAAPFVSPAANLAANAATPAADNGIPNTSPLGLAALTDISCRAEGGRLVPNTLGDLTKRENRFLHRANFPYVFQWAAPELVLDGPRLGEDIVLTNVIGFDVRVADIDAPVRVVSDGSKTYAVTPGERGFALGGPSGQTGAHVDLNWGEATLATAFTSAVPMSGLLFQGLGIATRNNTGATPPHDLVRATYCTWSTHYEYNGRDDDADGIVDQGSNAVDDNADSRIDEPAEAETRAPYPVRLRGIEVRIRCYEPTSRSIRQITIRHSFPER